MDTIDNATITRVWQRVHPGEVPTGPASLNDILYREQWVAATYARMLCHRKGCTNPLLQKLYHQKRRTVACIKGIYALLGQKPPRPAMIQPCRGTAETALRRCYAEQLQCIRLYEEYSTHPECGHAFSQLAIQTQQDCQNLLQLLGAFSQR